MGQFSCPFPDPGNANKRVVTDVQFEQLHHPQAPDGLVGNPTDPDLVHLDGATLKARPDRLGIVRGHLWGTDSTGLNLAPPNIPNGSGQTRVDLAVLRLTRADWKVTLEIRQGTPGAGAPAAVRDTGTTGVFELPLGEATLLNGVSTYSAFVPRAWYLGEDGTILCKPTTRPPVAPGLRIHEYGAGDSIRGYVGLTSTWLLLYEDTGRVNLPAATGWAVHTNGAWVRRRDGIVYLTAQFTRTSGNVTSGSHTLTTLPAGFRPAEQERILGYITGAYAGTVALLTNGQVVLNSYSQHGPSTGEYVALPTTAFPAA